MKSLQLWIACIALILLSACAVTNHLVSEDTGRSEDTKEKLAATLFAVAKSCWKRDESVLTAQVVVENIVTIDSIDITARFNSFGSGVLNPFIKFIVSGDGKNSKVELFVQQSIWIGREKFLHDARNWLNGIYLCN